LADSPHASIRAFAVVACGYWVAPNYRLVAWLLSDEADWVTGQTIASDGGFSSR
jgi:3-oxoacyl-[acyl-carrier protein] reductase